GSFLNAPFYKDLAKDFRFISVRRNLELFLSLPVEARDKLLKRLNYVKIL
ncbi:hypothetical protein QBC46DRAFT_263507, partial [Diplogelasinospora grovesii]